MSTLDGVSTRTVAVETPQGEARVHLHEVERAVGALVLGHGAGGGVAAPDLVAATEAAVSERVVVALVEQPYRVAGRKSPAPARQLDAAWTAVVGRLHADELRGLPLVVGGRSLGARVACRTVVEAGAVGVLCLAFPLQPPRRSGNAPSRLPELDAVPVPVLVVQGASDAFGLPPPGPLRAVVEVPGDHSLRKDTGAVAVAVREWLPATLSERARDWAYRDRSPHRQMEAGEVVRVVERLERAGVTAWLDGGWGVDALLGERTREHDDLDLVVEVTAAPTLVATLAELGYERIAGAPPKSFVLVDREGRQVDVHPVTFDDDGGGVYLMDDGRTWVYPAAGFAGTGVVDGKSVPCLTPEVQVLVHDGYELEEKDFRELELLHERFGVALPSGVRERLAR
jgi:predicted alpha/beta-hydrolase family hydrolase